MPSTDQIRHRNIYSVKLAENDHALKLDLKFYFVSLRRIKR